MKTKLLTILLALATLPVFSAVSGGVDYSSDYIWRGVSQTNGAPAWSGSLEVESNGLYGGVWASEVDVRYFVNADDSEKDFVAVTMNVPFIKVLDVDLEYGRHWDDTSYKQLTVSKDWRGALVGLQVLDSARHGTFMDHAALTIGWSF